MAKKQFKNKLRSLILGTLFLLSLYLFEQKQPPSLGFTLDKITSSTWAIPDLTDGEKSRLLQLCISQKFLFLGEGAQAYAFESQDHRYVIKLFKMQGITPSWSDHLCPLLYRRRLKGLRRVFNGYKEGYEELKEDSGLVFIHLHKTSYLNHPLTLIDETGKEHQIDLDRTAFVIQEKAELIFTYLKRLYAEGKHHEAQEAIEAIRRLIRRRAAKGFADRDHAVSFNYGFVGNRPIHIDLGRLYRGIRESGERHVLKRIERWKSENRIKDLEKSSSKN